MWERWKIRECGKRERREIGGERESGGESGGRERQREACVRESRRSEFGKRWWEMKDME